MHSHKSRLLILFVLIGLLCQGALADGAARPVSPVLPPQDAATTQAYEQALKAQFDVMQEAQTADQGFTAAKRSLDAAQAALAEATSQLETATQADSEAKAKLSELEGLAAELVSMAAAHQRAEKAQAVFSLAQEKEAAANDALDAADAELTKAHGLSEETAASLEQLMAALDERRVQLEELRKKIQASAEGQDTKALQDDVKTAEQAITAMEQQAAKREEDLRLANEQVVLAEKLQGEAQAAQEQTLTALADASAELTAAVEALSLVQLSVEEIAQAEKDNAAAILGAKTDCINAQNLVAAAQGKLEQTRKEADAAKASHDEAEARNTTAAETLAALQARWDAYKDIPGAVSEEGLMPAMDLVAASEMSGPIFTIHAQGQQIFIFQNGTLSDTKQCRERDVAADISLTRGKNGHVALRYVAADGKTYMEALTKDAQVIFTGEYAVIRLSDSLRGRTIYLGCACQVNTLDIPPVVAVMQLDEQSSLRYISERSFE